VRSKLNELDSQVIHKEHVLSSIQEKIDALREVENSLEREVGYLQTHKKCIEKIKDNLSFLTVSFSDAFDTGVIPVEVTTDWQQIRNAIKKLDSKMDDFFDDHAAIDGAAITGTLVD
jgi:DNA repair exonuclease SbcCD ATPase subunit